MDHIIREISLSISEDYNELKEKHVWEVYLSGIAYGVYMTSDRTVGLEEICHRIEEEVLILMN